MLRGLGSLLSRIFSSLFFYVPWCHFFFLLFRIIYFRRFFPLMFPIPHSLLFFPPCAFAALLPPFFISLPLPLYSFFPLSFLYFSTFSLASLLPPAPFHFTTHFLAATWSSRNLIDSLTFPENQSRPHSPVYNNAPACFRHSSWAAWPLMLGLIGCPETSVGSYQPTPRNIPEERSPQLHPGWSLNSRTRQLVNNY